MKKFRYKLENILKLKERMYEQISMGLKEIAAKRMAEEEILNQISARLHHENLSFASTTGQNLTADKLREKSKQISYLKELLISQTEVVEAIKIEEEELKQKLIAAYKEKEVYNKLKEKKFELYMEEEKVAEQNLLDEAVTNRYKVGNN